MLSSPMLGDPLIAQYEQWVYPEPIADLDAYVAAGGRDYSDPSRLRWKIWPRAAVPAGLRILVAGCGANQAAILAKAKPLADLAVTCGGDRGDGPWHPLAGSLVDQRKDWYRVEFVRGRSYTLHQRLAVLLLQKLVPAEAIAWLSAPGGPMPDLITYLSGEAKTGALTDLVTQADRQSVAANLMAGPRVRFTSARDVPLVERLMAGLRGMLAEGLLPLNRDGAAGFVADGSIWLVCKRTADELREYLEKHELAAPDGAPGLPSSFKNDRIFDTFQEYGALTPNPTTGGAVWTVQVGDTGWSHSLTMLRFPLEQLYQPTRIPGDFPGTIKVLEKKTAAGVATTQTDETVSAIQPVPPAAHEAVSTEPPQDSDSPKVDALAGLRALIDGDANGNESTGSLPQKDMQAAVTLVQPQPGNPDDVFLDDDEALMDVAVEQTLASQPMKTERTKAPQSGRSVQAVKQPKVPLPQVLAPVVPHTTAPPTRLNTGPENTPENAKRLMAWIQEGIGNGALAYNVPGALIHFVEENGRTLMLLVSPRTFRHYLDDIGESTTGEPEDKIGAALQRDFFKAQWHRAGPKKMNILRYRVKRRGSEGSLLSVVVIPHPERFVNPLPSPNPHIEPFTSTVDGEKS